MGRRNNNNNNIGRPHQGTSLYDVQLCTAQDTGAGSSSSSSSSPSSSASGAGNASDFSSSMGGWFHNVTATFFRDDNNKVNDTRPFPAINITIPTATVLIRRTCLGIVLTLYVLNQKHVLPKPLSRVVSKALFWPSMPITVSRRIGRWTTNVDDTVMMGGAPFAITAGFRGFDFCNYPEELYRSHGIRGVINMCEEYRGPVREYKRLGMRHLRLPTADHFEPSVDDLKSAVSFIRQHEARGERVYVHCRAGHGRSAAAVFAWLLFKDPIGVDPQELNKKLCGIRNVRKSLWKQSNIQQFHTWLKLTGGGGGQLSSSSSFWNNKKKSNENYWDNNISDESDSDSFNSLSLSSLSTNTLLESIRRTFSGFFSSSSLMEEEGNSDREESYPFEHDDDDEGSTSDAFDYDADEHLWNKYK